jgi:hypothetical protein
VNSAEVSISGGSDTEASRSEATKLRDEEKGHARTASTAKKPATFKSVSVNKTFLAAKSAAGAAPAKATDKASASAGLATGQGGSAPAAARPRLVAKTGSGLRDLPRSGANGARPAGVPDPSAVWNKNRRKYLIISRFPFSPGSLHRHQLRSPRSSPTRSSRNMASIWRVDYSLTTPMDRIIGPI